MINELDYSAEYCVLMGGPPREQERVFTELQEFCPAIKKVIMVPGMQGFQIFKK